MRRAVTQGINLLAVTDHDTMLGLAAAEHEAAKQGIGFIPGVEISTAGDDEVHVLGYFVDSGMTELAARLQAFRDDKDRRGPESLQRLTELGMPLTLEDLQLPPGVACSRPMIARAMIRKGYVASVQEAFDRWLAVGMPAYVAKRHVDPGEAIALLNRAGAVPVVAHPALMPYEAQTIPALLDKWQAQGLMGIEAYHPMHNPEECRFWEKTARDRGLLVTGGSDFHDGLPPHAELGHMLPLWQRKDEDARHLLAACPREVAV